MRRPFLMLVPLLLSACQASGNQESEKSVPNPPLVRVEEQMEHEAREAGFRDGELAQAVAEQLAAAGVRVTTHPSEGDMIVSVELTLLRPGIPGFTGLLRVSTWEPATVWADKQDRSVITTLQDAVFASPEDETHDYVMDNLRDAVRDILGTNHRLGQGMTPPADSAHADSSS